MLVSTPYPPIPVLQAIRSVQARVDAVDRHFRRRDGRLGDRHLRHELAELPGDERHSFLPVHFWHRQRHRGNLQHAHEICAETEDSMKARVGRNAGVSTVSLSLFIRRRVDRARLKKSVHLGAHLYAFILFKSGAVSLLSFLHIIHCTRRYPLRRDAHGAKHASHGGAPARHACASYNPSPACMLCMMHAHRHGFFGFSLNALWFVV